MLSRVTKIDAQVFKAAAAALAIFASQAATPAAKAQIASPFAMLAGSWSGGGAIQTSNGNERIRCRAAYAVVGDRNLNLNLRCASDSYNFDLHSTVTYNGGSVTGSWTEASRNVSGSISGHASGNRIQVKADGPSFAANLLLLTHGSNQSVTIQTSGSDIRGVQLALRR